MDIIDGITKYWQILSLLGMLAILLARLEWVQKDHREKINAAATKEELRELRDKVIVAARQEELADVRKDVAELEAETKGTKSSLEALKLEVSNRLTAIETTLNGGLQRIESIVREISLRS